MKLNGHNASISNSTNPQVSAPDPTPASELSETESQLRDVVQSLINLGISVYDFDAKDTSKEGLVEQLNKFTRELDELSIQSMRLDEQFPIDVVQYIENGRNPDVYTREFVELTGKQNQYINGKMKAMREFRDILGNTITEAYPELKPAVENVNRRTGGPAQA